MRVYCDETGFTGNNLLDEKQRFFVYSSVAIEPHRSEELVNQLVKDYKLQGNELKGGRLVKYERGLKAIRWLLSQCREDSKLIFVDKPFTLACKFHEYIFEPLYSNSSGLFYEAGFHKFIANSLHKEWSDGNARARSLLLEFQELMRTKDRQVAPQLFSGASSGDSTSEQIMLFTFMHKEAILKHIEELRGFDPANWILETTHTSLFSLLTHWATKGEQLEVYCDDSKPLSAQKDFLDNFIGRESSEFKLLRSLESTFFPNLSGPIQLVDSNAHYGIQIADALGAGLCYALNNIREEKGAVLYEEYGPTIHSGVFPETEYIDGIEEQSFVNSLILLSLIDRSARQQSLVDGMPEYIEFMQSQYPEYKQTVEARVASR
ncbi:MAG TPA: DUF3800 domain-containing protein [Blastocatellia bacterium]|nr:DUF3800 domain-containing protein [Blastocatellia bacterium]